MMKEGGDRGNSRNDEHLHHLDYGGDFTAVYYTHTKGNQIVYFKCCSVVLSCTKEKYKDKEPLQPPSPSLLQSPLGQQPWFFGRSG